MRGRRHRVSFSKELFCVVDGATSGHFREDCLFRNSERRAGGEFHASSHWCWVKWPFLGLMDAWGWAALAVGCPGTTRLDAAPAE
jgi:hypothetical protein